MNDALHWNSIADNYDKEIFNVFKNDKKKKLKKYLAKYANKENIAIDFGCGVGYPPGAWTRGHDGRL